MLLYFKMNSEIVIVQRSNNPSQWKNLHWRRPMSSSELTLNETILRLSFWPFCGLDNLVGYNIARNLTIVGRKFRPRPGGVAQTLVSCIQIKLDFDQYVARSFLPNVGINQYYGSIGTRHKKAFLCTPMRLIKSWTKKFYGTFIRLTVDKWNSPSHVFFS